MFGVVRSLRSFNALISPVKTRLLAAFLMSVLAAGCATLPTNAPTVHEVISDDAARESSVPYEIIEIDAQVAREASAKAEASELSSFRNLAATPLPPRADLIRKGDMLDLSIYEVGITLFAPAGAAVGPTSTPAANVQRFAVPVREDGQIDLPYIGSVQAEGTYPDDLARTIRNRLRGLSQSPEVLVRIAESVENVAIISGDIARPGRYPLTSARERLLELIALGGGPRSNANDTVVRFVRGDWVSAIRLNELRMEDIANVVVLPGDRIELVTEPKTFTVFGATDRVSQIPFESRDLTLAEAIARAAGPSDSRANPRGIFLFRLEEPPVDMASSADTLAVAPANGLSSDEMGAADESMTPVATVDVPGETAETSVQATIYQINMKKPESYIVAQMFKMQDKDVLLFANSSANLTNKFITMINQLLSPAITAATVSNATR